MKKIAIALSAVLATNSGQAHDTVKCRDISDSLARLSCYDSSHGVPTNSKVAVKEPAPTEIESSAQSKKTEDSAIGEPQSLFSKKDNGPISSRLIKVVRRPKASTRIYLDNEQIWQLTKERLLSASTGDAVRVKSGTVGGYMMSVNDGLWLRVKRIN